MRGSTAFRAAVAPGGVLAGPWVKNELWRRAKAVPSLDLRFADDKSLRDAVTGQSLITFTRASSGTFVGSDGVLRTATTNLLLRSEELDNASWTKQASVSVTANAVVAPNGTLTADTVTADLGVGVFQNITSVVGLNYANSVYVKAGTATSLLLRDDTGAGRHIQFNPSTGQITATSGTLVGSGSQALGDGWFRVWMIYAADATTVRGIIRPASSGSGQTFTVWGAQLEQSSTVGEYIPTTSTINSAPRFDHNPTTTESLGLLVEEQRTNSTTYSQDFGNAAIGKNNSTVTDNTATSPAGDSTADKVIEDVANSEHGVTLPNFSYAANTVYTFTIFAKAVERNRLRVLLPEASFGQNKVAWFDLSNGSVIQTSGTGVTSSVAAYPNGWYRCAISATTTTAASGTAAQLRLVNTGTTVTYTGDNTSGLLLWGAQLEAGAFATSYIPTTTATVTRSADVASITGTAFSSWYRQDEGTVFADATINGIASQNYLAAIDAGSGFANSNLLYLVNGTPRFETFVSSSQQCQLVPLPSNAVTTGSSLRMAAGYATNNFGAARNGGAPSIDVSGDLPTVNRLLIGASNGTALVTNGTIRRLTYWPRRLGNEVLQEVTR